MRVLAGFLLLAHFSVCAQAVYVTQSGNEVTIGNSLVARTFSIAGDRVQTVRIENKRANAVAAVAASAEFRLRVSQGTQVDGTDATLAGADFALASWTSTD